MARKGNTMAANILARQLPNDDPRVRAQVAQALGEAPLETADILLPAPDGWFPPSSCSRRNCGRPHWRFSRPPQHSRNDPV